MEECDLERAGWAAPFRSRPLPFTLRSDVLDFVSTHFATENTAAKVATAAVLGELCEMHGGAMVSLSAAAIEKCDSEKCDSAIGPGDGSSP